MYGRMQVVELGLQCPSSWAAYSLLVHWGEGNGGYAGRGGVAGARG